MKITSNFDSGNIKVIEAVDPLNIQLEINKDNQSDFFQLDSARRRGAEILPPSAAPRLWL